MSGEATRRELVSAAERLFAEKGVEGPSLREITREAAQGNTAALQYHFGDRDALLQAVMAKHLRDVDVHRQGLLDKQHLEGDPTLRELAGVLVLPLVAKLDDVDGGPEFLQILGEVVARPGRFGPALGPVTTSRGMERWSRAVEPLLPPAAVGRPLHRRFAAIRFTSGELASRAREGRRRDHRLFTSHLVDLVGGLLGTPVSDETRRLIR